MYTDAQGTSYVSRRRLDDADFDPNAVDEDGLPLVYNEQRIAGVCACGGRGENVDYPWCTTSNASQACSAVCGCVTVTV